MGPGEPLSEASSVGDPTMDLEELLAFDEFLTSTLTSGFPPPIIPLDEAAMCTLDFGEAGLLRPTDGVSQGDSSNLTGASPPLVSAVPPMIPNAWTFSDDVTTCHIDEAMYSVGPVDTVWDDISTYNSLDELSTSPCLVNNLNLYIDPSHHGQVPEHLNGSSFSDAAVTNTPGPAIFFDEGSVLDL
ncbi:hypothetical protein VPNG_01320 [Cytospora leucostoma]|uniref:Uncharacterized protein n=1 Tax=Cytospora leucostoma TaxID=1230097 RepID=A0A423XLI5_9PEZI|nr:hypothetical protein VPNG_01320 [Cytospora leucostoma]